MMTQERQQAVVEPNATGDAADVTQRALQQRIRQQELLAELGVMSLQSPPLEQLLKRAVEMTAEGLQADYAKVMEFIPKENKFLVVAGVGWGPDVIGKATIGADLASPAGFALRTGKPVISNHLEHEQRFRTPELLARHGVRRAMNVILQGDGAPYGVLEVDSRSEGEFVPHDLAFLQGAANLLGMAIERQRHESSLRAALERQRLLLREINHRVKNSLGLVCSMLAMQARASDNGAVKASLEEAASRVIAIARAHERLYQTSEFERLDIGTYLKDICQGLVTECSIEAVAPNGIEVSTDRAISLALIMVELVTNAAKYAYPGGRGRIWVTVAGGRHKLLLSVKDEGVGLPDGFDLQKAKGLGMRIVQTLATQLGAEVEARRGFKGVEFVVRVPIEQPAGPS
ncbi:MAG TPA: histidine kinase dimerization/phosphoacceptor domain -containing protein [Hyphomicrobiaceae bacterium]|nr:histidine kinase dimerization/phosphoacceptor domain -containing protein [Hyphomicrobiaceae bacterium]